MKRLWTLLGLIIAALTCGCVERELTITSDPPGALVSISDREVGRTPVTIAFTWYGDYDIVLRRDGYKTLDTHAHINAPAHQIPPLDLFAEIVPWTIYDRRYVHFKMDELVPQTDAELIRRADALKERNLRPVSR